MPISNPARRRLEAGEAAIGIGLRQARTVDIAPAMATAGYDWLFIDLEHGTMDLDMAMQISIAANGAGITPLVRVPAGQYSMATRALDGGAMGIVIPHIDTAAEAREMVAKLRYPPQGKRSVAGAMAQIAFASRPIGEASAEINRSLLLVAMLETPTAIANAETIAAVPGIDCLLIGTNDLTMELGIPGQQMHGDVVKAYQTAAAACRKHGKWLGTGGVSSEEGIAKYMAMGARLVHVGSDFGLLMAAAGARAKVLRAAQ